MSAIDLCFDDFTAKERLMHKQEARHADGSEFLGDEMEESFNSVSLKREESLLQHLLSPHHLRTSGACIHLFYVARFQKQMSVNTREATRENKQAAELIKEISK